MFCICSRDVSVARIKAFDEETTKLYEKDKGAFANFKVVAIWTTAVREEKIDAFHTQRRNSSLLVAPLLVALVVAYYAPAIFSLLLVLAFVTAVIHEDSPFQKLGLLQKEFEAQMISKLIGNVQV